MTNTCSLVKINIFRPITPDLKSEIDYAFKVIPAVINTAWTCFSEQLQALEAAGGWWVHLITSRDP